LHLLSDVCTLGTGALLDQLSLEIIVELCQKFKVGVPGKNSGDEQRQQQQELLESEIKKKGHSYFLSRLTAKSLRSICSEIKINKDQKKPEMQDQLAEEIVLLGTESLFSLISFETLIALCQAMTIECPPNLSQEDIIEKLITDIFDLSPLEDALKLNQLAVTPKEEPSSSEEEVEEEPRKGVDEKTKGRKPTRGEGAKPPICAGILRSELHKYYTVPELRTFVKENFDIQDVQMVQKFKKEQIIGFILDRLEPENNPSRKRALEKKENEPPEKYVKR